MKFNESTLKSYAAPLSETEDAKCKRAIKEIRDALTELGYTDDQKDITLLESDTLAYSISMRNKFSTEKIHIFIQGSYANNTCVRNESDVDIAIVRNDTWEYAFGETFSSATSNERAAAEELKNSVERALHYSFPYQVYRGNKSIKVEGNTYRKKADVVPCFSLHYHFRSHLKDYLTHHEGVVIFADDGSIIENFPKQHISNGKAKNNQTNHYYKKMVRIMKKMRHLMSDYGYSCAEKVSSFGVESLLWNIPNDCFTTYYCYGNIFKQIVDYVYSNKASLSNYYEANGIKKLCLTQQDIDDYSDFIDALHSFFEYEHN